MKQYVDSLPLVSAFPVSSRLWHARQFFLWLAGVLSIGGSVPAFSQGSLTPPVAPAPIMKRLDEVEARTNLQAAPVPAGVDTSNANYHFIINQPGSYYLSANLAVTKANGIQINAENVTIDLNGFEISRASGSGGDGIQIAVTSHRSTILSGSVKGFAVGINGLDDPNSARGCKFRDLSVSGCTSTGIFSGPSAALESCRVQDNTGSSGITSGAGSTLTNCTASTNTVTFGISAGVGSHLVRCSAYSNTCAIGIFADSGSALTHCTAFLNIGTTPTSSGIATANNSTITACTASANISNAATRTPTTGIGFDLGGGSTIQECTASSNRGDGIRLSSSSLARKNDSSSNGSSGDGAGIHVRKSENRIEGNNVVGNSRGIDVDGAGNVIVKNTARANTVNYDLVTNNVFGTILDRTAPASAAVSGNGAANSTGTTDPLANISY